jgi:MFS family permease
MAISGAGGEQVTSTLQVRVAWTILFVTVGLGVLGLGLLPAQEWQLTMDFVGQVAGNGLLTVACSAVGVLIISRRPGNVIGWIYALVALAMALGGVAGGYAERSLPGFRWVALLPDLLWLVTVPVGVMLLMLLFPTGQLPSSRWRPVVWVTIGATVVAVVGTALTPGPVEYYPDLQNPLGVAGAGPVLDVIVGVGFVVMVAGVFAAAGSLIVRWRRARGVERQQLKWLAYAAGLLVVAQLSASMLPRPLFLVVSYTAALLFPVATGIAVVRYRLYDIDRLINRTLVYGLLTATLGLAYAGVVLVLGQLFGGIGDRPPSWAVAGATLAVAALVQPARRRIQAIVDRQFNRRRYDAVRTVEAFSARLRDQVDLDTLTAELLSVVEQTMQPSTASLWLRPSVQEPQRTGT